MNATPGESKDKDIVWPWFALGCILLAIAAVAFFWGFALGELSRSQHFLLMWILPLSSGFACGAFAGSMRSRTKGTVTVVATGGFAVWVLTYFFLPDPIQGADDQILQTIDDGHARIRRELDAAEERTEQPEKFGVIRTEIEIHLDGIRDAVEDGDAFRTKELMKGMGSYLDSEPAREVIEPFLQDAIRKNAYTPKTGKSPWDGILRDAA